MLERDAASRGGGDQTRPDSGERRPSRTGPRAEQPPAFPIEEKE